MKIYITILLLFLVAFSCDSNKPDPRDRKEQTAKEVDYNIEKSEWVISLVSNTKPVKFSFNINGVHDRYTLQYDTVKFDLYHTHQKEFESVEKWSYYGTYKNGRHMLLQSTTGVPEHQLSPEALDLLRQKCIDMVKKMQSSIHLSEPVLIEEDKKYFKS